MSLPLARLEGRLRIAGILIATGLLIEAVTMAFVHPIALLAFVGLGGGLIGVGILVYLLTLARLD